MKVGIITFQDTTNYGALLQAKALFDCVEGYGADCSIVDYQCANIVKREVAPAPLVGGAKQKAVTFLLNRLKKKKYKKMCAFVNRHLRLSESCDKQTVESVCKPFDKLIVGSDMIWELNVTGEDYTYFLDFEKNNEKKFSYAASFGYDDVPDAYRENCKTYLERFNKISVREQQGKQIVYSLTGREVPVVLDPTLLLNTEGWEKYIDKKVGTKKGYVLVYFNDKDGNVLKYAKKLAKEKGLDVVYVDNRIHAPKGVILKRYPSVNAFLGYLYNAQYVVTASYHGVAFSINFNKQFYYFNRSHKGRIETLVNALGIENRNIAESDVNAQNISYELVNPLLAKEREKSMQVLKEELE